MSSFRRSGSNNKIKLVSLIARLTFLGLFAITVSRAVAGDPNFPPPIAGDFVIHNFHFRSGETLPELRMHYLTFGSPQRDANGIARNAVLILHGTTGSSAQFLRPEFA